MSFSSRRRNYLLTPHRRDGLVEWMKSMLQHSFVLDALEATAADTFSHFEDLIEEHRSMRGSAQPSRLQQLVPTVGVFHTHLPLREAFELYNHKYRLTKRKHIQISFNEIRHIMNLAQILALRQDIPGKAVQDLLASYRSTHGVESCAFFLQTPDPASSSTTGTSLTQEDDSDMSFGGGPPEEEDVVDGRSSADGNHQALNGPSLLTFDADQTLPLDGKKFQDCPQLMRYMELLLRNGVSVALITSVCYDYDAEEYEDHFSGLLEYFAKQKLSEQECERFYVFGGDCNYLFQLGASDYRLHLVNEKGAGGWMITTQFISEAPGNWEASEVEKLLNKVEVEAQSLVEDLGLEEVACVIRNQRSVGIVPEDGCEISRETLDEVVLCFQEQVEPMNEGNGPGLPYCAFNAGSEAWVNVGSKRVGVQILQAYLGIESHAILHVGDQFLYDFLSSAGNTYAATAVSPCLWVINPQETAYILKSILRLAGIHLHPVPQSISIAGGGDGVISPQSRRRERFLRKSSSASIGGSVIKQKKKAIDFRTMERRNNVARHRQTLNG